MEINIQPELVDFVASLAQRENTTPEAYCEHQLQKLLQRKAKDEMIESINKAAVNDVSLYIKAVADKTDALVVEEVAKLQAVKDAQKTLVEAEVMETAPILTK